MQKKASVEFYWNQEVPVVLNNKEGNPVDERIVERHVARQRNRYLAIRFFLPGSVVNCENLILERGPERLPTIEVGRSEYRVVFLEFGSRISSPVCLRFRLG